MKRRNCSHEHCTLPVWSKGLCKFHNARKIASEAAPRYEEYKKLKRAYIMEHPYCEVEGCTLFQDDIHHKAGRIGDNLFKNFMSVCREHHIQIESHPQWAYEHGYSLKRHTK